MTDEREAASVAANNNKRKDLKKIKRDKEEKKTNKNKSDPNGNKTDSESSPPAFLSRIFRSRRSSKRINNKKATSNNTVAEPLKVYLFLFRIFQDYFINYFIYRRSLLKSYYG